ncbi:Nucleoredoxin [Hondaea fermentalgiana]|uniref:protein-disulfide reductase n=1 Tax=Hondaea fermentalgiana TaxID=2315210 RepID=A0A2R5GEU0_9STRA|nr:Nucleoredoxin [Hondaea fermentalgiana]|eukprot:GBG26771.1 Nucleoredoxin [Hondaea fermentalgiana]
MLTDPSSEVGVGDEVYMEGDVYSDMLFTYGVKTVVDAQGTRVPVELALGGKLVGVLFTSANGSDPVAKGVAFTDRLESLAAANKDTFAVLYVSQDKLEPEMTEFLSRHPSFFALPFEDKNTGETLKEALGAMEMFFPTLMVLDTTGMCISTWGRSAVMWNPKYCLMDWKNGREGVTTSQLLLHRFF